MSVDTYIKKTKLNNSDYNSIANMPYMDQIEIFKNRSLNKFKLLNPQRYPKEQNMNE